MRYQVSLLAILLLITSWCGDPLRAQQPEQPASSLESSIWDGYDAVGSQWSDLPPVDRVAVEIGTLGLVREEPNDVLLAVDQNGAPLLNASQFQGDIQFGLKTSVDFRNVRNWFGGTDLQLGYFGINSLDAGRTATAQEINYIFFNSFPVNRPSTINFHYSSNIYSGEANLRLANWRRIRPITGLRYFKLEDTFDTFNPSGSGTRIGGFSTTNNSMFGGQFGLEGDLWRRRRFDIYSFGKVGLMHNRIEGSASAANANSAPVTRNYSDSHFATLVDAGVGANIRVAGPLSFKVGYHALYASQLALGIDQTTSVNLLSSAGAIAFNSQQWHGLDFVSVWEF